MDSQPGLLGATAPKPQQEEAAASWDSVLAPTAFIGVSYFFNDVVGLNYEAGYNFTYISIGLNFRLTK